MSETMTELKPCPFCGERKATMFEPTCRPETPYNPADRLFPIVRCNCGAEVSGKNEDYRGNSAIEAWNTRAPEAAAALTTAEARIQELEAIIDNAKMAYAETHPDDETRCRFMAAALSAVDD